MGIGVWEQVFRGNLPKNSKWWAKDNKRLKEKDNLA